MNYTAMSGESWSGAEDEYLRSHYGSVPNVELALDLKRTSKAVQLRAALLGLSRHRPPATKPSRSLDEIRAHQEERALVYLAALATMTASAVGREYGVSKNTVIGVCNRYKRRVGRVPRTAVDARSVIELPASQ